MGYSVTMFVPKGNRKLADKMILFCEKQLRPFGEVAGWPVEENGKHHFYWFGPVWAKGNLSYCRREGHLGFDYNCGGSQRDYLYYLVHWLVIKLGCKTKKGEYRYLYDGYDWEVLDMSRFDKLGCRTEQDLRNDPILKRLPEKIFTEERKYLDLIKKEIHMLDKKWAEFVKG